MTQDGAASEIFRKEAIDRLVQQGGVEASLGLSPTRRWVTLVATLLLAAAALLFLWLYLQPPAR